MVEIILRSRYHYIKRAANTSFENCIDLSRFVLMCRGYFWLLENIFLPVANFFIGGGFFTGQEFLFNRSRILPFENFLARQEFFYRSRMVFSFVEII